MSHSTRGAIFKLFRALLFPWISRIRTLTGDFDKLREMEGRGQLIFVSQATSFIDFLIVDEQLRKAGLQGLRFSHGLNPFLVLPFKQAFAIFWEGLFLSVEKRRQKELESLLHETAQGGHGYVWLKRGMRFDTEVEYVSGYFGRLATMMADEEDRNPFLIPTSIFLTRMRKKNQERTAMEIFFGTYDFPGRLRKLYQLLIHSRKGGSIFSEAIDLRAEQTRQAEMNADQIDKRVRLTLLLHINNEDRAYRGPTKNSRQRKIQKILQEKRLNEELEKAAERTGRSLESVKKEAAKNLNDIASDTSERVVNMMRMLFDYVWSRTLEGIDVRQEDLDRIRKLSKDGPVVFLPCHRSHVDYLSVAYLFEIHGLNFPRIAAGDNLSKWPLGPVLRRCGAFFLRRSFKGEAIFPLVFDAYVRHVLRERHVLLFFPEGGRSRTGKLLHPKMGLLSMVLDAWRENVVEDIPLVPVTIDYGKVFEGGSYLREKSGLPKEKEDLRSVLRSREVLKKKHGVMRLRFGDPIYLNEYVTEAGFTRDSLGFKARVPLLNDISYEVMNRINQKVTLTAGNVIAGLLMGTPRRGMTQSLLKKLFVISVRHFQTMNVEMAFTEKKLDLAMENALSSFEASETIVRVSVGGEVVININEGKRSEMEYYKNNGLHYILDLGLFCMARKLLLRGERTMDAILENAKDIYDLLNYEFLVRDDYPNMEHMEGALKAMTRLRALDLDESGQVVRGPYEPGADLNSINAHLLENFLESYFAVMEVLSELEPEQSMDKKALLKLILAKAKLLYAVGTLRREESINHVSFGNALTRFNKMGFIKMRTPKGQKQPVVTLNMKKRDEFMALKDKIYVWLRRLS